MVCHIHDNIGCFKIVNIITDAIVCGCDLENGIRVAINPHIFGGDILVYHKHLYPQT